MANSANLSKDSPRGNYLLPIFGLIRIGTRITDSVGLIMWSFFSPLVKGIGAKPLLWTTATTGRTDLFVRWLENQRHLDAMADQI